MTEERTWHDYQKEADKGEPLCGGPARPIYTACDARCLYCGMGIGNTDNPEMQFDVWRHLTIEHIIPERIWPPSVCEAMKGWSRGTIPETLETLERLWSLNQICSCHLCNVRLNRYPNQEQHKNDNLQQFWEVALGLQPEVDRSGGGISVKWGPLRLDQINEVLRDKDQEPNWWGSVVDEIYKVWQGKAQVARKKICESRNEFRFLAADFDGKELQPARAWNSCGDLDEKAKDILKEEKVHVAYQKIHEPKKCSR